MTTQTIDVPETPEAVQAVINGLTDRLNALGEVQWGELVAGAETPADVAEMVWSLQTIAGLLQAVAAAAYEPIRELFTGMVAAALAGADEATQGEG